MSRYHCRCRKCDTRQVLPRPPDLFIRPRVCRGCGKRGTLRVDRWMQQRKTSPYQGGDGCNCGGYWFPHRRGSLYCEQRANREWRLPGDVDFRSRFVLE